MTGVNPITLRTWERRYGLISPARTDSGHRLYRDEDVALVQRVMRLLNKGVPIGRVLDALSDPNRENFTAPCWESFKEQMFKAIVEYDERSLENTYQEALSLYPQRQVTDHVLIPTLETLGTRWLSSPAGIAEEHFFAVYMRNKLGARFHHRSMNVQGPRLIAACLPSEQHEIGLLLFSLTAHDRGYRLILLGADMPLEGIGAAVKQTAAHAVVLSGTSAPPDDLWQSSLKPLVQSLSVPVFVGGPICVRHRTFIRHAGAISLGNDDEQALDLIDKTLNEWS